MVNRCLNLDHGSISKEEFELKRLSPLYSIGEETNLSVKCNRKFFIQDLNTIIFKPSRKEKNCIKN